MENKILIGLLFVFCLSFISAWPYQLNTTNGQIIDLNSSNNETSNLTIYVIHQTNTTIINATTTTIVNNTINTTSINNITNITCINCTYVYNMSMAWSNWTYNFSDIDAKFLKIGDFNSYKLNVLVPASKTEFDALVSKVNSINLTSIPETTTSSTTTLWWISIIALLLGLLAIIIAWKAGSLNE